MPVTHTISDLQRNINDIYELCEQQDQPTCITCNGHADLVVISAEAYEQHVLLRQQVYEHEKKLQNRAMQTYESMKAGQEYTLNEIEREMGLI